MVHELTNLHERHHNERFTALLNQHLRQWRVLRDELNGSLLAEIYGPSGMESVPQRANNRQIDDVRHKCRASYNLRFCITRESMTYAFRASISNAGNFICDEIFIKKII